MASAGRARDLRRRGIGDANLPCLGCLYHVPMRGLHIYNNPTFTTQRARRVRMRRAFAHILVLCGMFSVAVSAYAAKVNVEVIGVTDPIKTNVMNSLSIVRYKDYGAHPATTIERLNRKAPAEIQAALEPYGYFSPHIDAQLSHQGANWTAVYRINPGEPVTLRQVTVRVTGPGAKASAFQKVIANTPLKTGQRLDQSDYSATKNALQFAAAEVGYLDAHFTTHRLEVNPQTHSAEATLVYATGPRYRFGQITIHQKILNPAFVRRYVKFKPGDPYNAQALANLQSALSASGYFSSVIVNPEKKKAKNRRVPIEIETTPAKRNHFSFGLGYGTDTGPRFSFGWDVRRINSEGHRFSFNTRISGIETQAVARYIVPLANPATDRLVYSATLNEQDYGGTVSHLLGVGATRITMLGGWQQSLFLKANRYVSDIGPDSFTTRVLMPGVLFSRIVAHPPSRPQTGFSVNAEFSGAAKSLASGTTFLRADISARFIFPFGPGRLLLHGEAGAIAANDFAEMPVALRFYTGGSASLRGYSYQSIGPRNAQGLVIGGRFLKVASVEYDFPIAGPWGIAGFFDAGTASDNFNAPFQKDVGIGVRYHTPVGAVRLDFGHPIGHPELSPIHISLSIGLAL
ncbi:MAG: autotransporter assembly complex protein TamA [Gammaproteobacteria bacterium]